MGWMVDLWRWDQKSLEPDSCHGGGSWIWGSSRSACSFVSGLFLRCLTGGRSGGGGGSWSASSRIRPKVRWLGGSRFQVWPESSARSIYQAARERKLAWVGRAALSVVVVRNRSTAMSTPV